MISIIRIELEEFKKVGPIERIEYGTRTVNYTTIIFIKKFKLYA